MRKLDGICCFGIWCTSAHIETGGDDSITFVPVGKKFMLIAKRGNASRRLGNLFKPVKNVLHCLSKPPSSLMKWNVKFFITDPNSFLVQPSLCAHTAITWGGGPSLFMGFEGKQENDITWQKQVLPYHSAGIAKERRKFLLQSHSDADIVSILKVDKKENTALFEHINCFQYDDTPSQSSSTRFEPRIAKRKRKLLHIGRNRIKARRHIENKNNKCSGETL